MRDTIAAISTPVGEGGIAVIRVSGPDSSSIGSAIFKGKKNGGFQSHLFYYGHVCDPSAADFVDEVMLVFMQNPRSYTREDVLEIHCHGGYLVAQRVLQTVLRQGARLAEPGEFTKRAFLNGRIDLVQAEAVIDVIRSKTEAALSLAQRQREGVLSRKIWEVRSEILHALALVEAYIDFPEEDLDLSSAGEIQKGGSDAIAMIDALLVGFDEGRVFREGVSVLIAGKPNVGKSSLLNTLLQDKRAIVTSVPGTTRDIIEEVVNIRGLPVSLIDTAGVRETEDLVEREGIRMTLEKIPEADMVLFVLDSSRPFDADDRMILDALEGKRCILISNKSDIATSFPLPALLSGAQLLPISTRTGEGIDGLKDALFDAFVHGCAVDNREFVAISHVRHRDALIKAGERLGTFLANFGAGADLELLAVDLRDALSAVGEVTGETTPDQLLDLIFSRFCIGK